MLILLVFPAFLYFFVTLKFGKEHQMSTYYIVTGVVVLIATTVGHVYYYKVHNLNIFPSKDYIKFFLVVPLLGLVFVSIFQFVFRFKKKDSRLSFKFYAYLFIFIAVFLNWLIPLGHKYLYVERLDKMEELFVKNDGSKVVQDGEIMIALVKSAYDPLMRPRYRSPSHYDTYFYIKNDGDMPYRGNIYLTLYNEGNETFEMKLLENVEVGPHSTELMIEEENALTNDKWSQRTFGTKQRVESFDALIAQ